MNKIYILLLIICGFHFTGHAQTIFQMHIGNNSHDLECVALQTSDGGYAGITTHEEFGDQEICMIRLDYDGSFLWSKTFTGQGGAHTARDLKQTSDGGFIICGTLEGTSNGDMAYLIRTNASGDTIWTRTYVASPFGGGAYGYAVQQTTDGGFIVTGYANIVNGNYNDLMLMKIAVNGDLTWTKVFGGNNDDHGYSVQQTSDGGYIAAGKSYSYGPGSQAMFLVRTNSSGLLLWSGIYGSAAADEANCVRQTPDGGFIAFGSTDGFGAGIWDFLLLKTDADGNVQWTKMYGTTNWDLGYTVRPTPDGGYILAGDGNADALAIKIISTGDTLWTRAYGTNFAGQFFNVVNTWDGGYMFSGETGSLLGDWEDLYLVKTDALGNSGCNEFQQEITVTNVIPTGPKPTYTETGAGSIMPHVTTIETPVLTDSIMCVHVGIHEYEQRPLLTAFPNPFENEFTLKGTSRHGEVVLYDAMGNEMLKKKTNETSTLLDAKELAPGLYFYLYFEGEKCVGGRVFKY